MSRSIWSSNKACPDLKAGMVIKYADKNDNVSGYYLLTYGDTIPMNSRTTPVAGQGHLGPINKGSVLEVWNSLSDFLLDMGINVLTEPINF